MNAQLCIEAPCSYYAWDSYSTDEKNNPDGGEREKVKGGVSERLTRFYAAQSMHVTRCNNYTYTLSTVIRFTLRFTFTERNCGIEKKKNC